MDIWNAIRKNRGIAGVYKITNTITDEFYVGASKDIGRRWDEHVRPSHCGLLQKYFQKYGLENFQFQILEITSRENLAEREKYWIEGLKPFYNKKQGGGGITVRELSEKSKNKMSLVHKVPHPWNKGKIPRKVKYLLPDGSVRITTPNVAGRLRNLGIDLVEIE